MKEVTFKRITEKAKTLQGWHFHMLSPSCKFNLTKNTYCIIFEYKEQAVCSIFRKKPLSEAKSLANIQYADKLQGKDNNDSSNPDFERIMKAIEQMSSQGAEWHHHHIPPRCRYNPRPGKHCLMLEDKKQTLYAFYDHFPTSDLAKIETLFYKDLIAKQ